jgi:glycosyltransferase involved in cell wall biosynthesis
MNSQYSVDVLIPFHRDDQFLAKCIESVERSIGVNLRILLCDDRQKFDVPLSPYLEKYKIIQTTGGRGFSNAINILSESIKSEFVTLVGSDDLVHPEKFVRQVELLNKTGASLCLTNVGKIDASGKPLLAISPYCSLRNFSNLYLLFGPYGADGTWLSTNQWWRENATFPPGNFHDWELAIKTFPNSSIVSLDAVLYYYRMHEAQSTRSVSFYVDKNLASFLEAWHRFNRQFNLPNLTLEEFLVVSHPWGTSRNKSCDTSKMEKWQRAWISQLDRQERSGISQVILAKNVIRFIKHKIWLNYDILPSEFVHLVIYYLRVLIKLALDPVALKRAFFYSRGKYS